MTPAASQLAVQSFTRLHQRATGLSVDEPLFIGCGFHHHYSASHARMLRAAKFGAEKIKRADAIGFEPFGGVAAGDDVLFDAEIG